MSGWSALNGAGARGGGGGGGAKDSRPTATTQQQAARQRARPHRCSVAGRAPTRHAAPAPAEMSERGGDADSSSCSEPSSGTEAEDMAALTADVRSLKEALASLRHAIAPASGSTNAVDRESQRVEAHACVGEVTRILRAVLDKYPAMQSARLLAAAGALVQHMKGFDFESNNSEPKEFFECIDQLALAFSSRVSEYLMGDLDAPGASPANRSLSRAKSLEDVRDGDSGGGALLSARRLQAQLRGERVVPQLLQRAKAWARHAKELAAYVHKRSYLHAEYAKGLAKLAQALRPALHQASNLPFQSEYSTALDHDVELCNNSQTVCCQLDKKYVQALTDRRSEHERVRKQLKARWAREDKNMPRGLTLQEILAELENHQESDDEDDDVEWEIIPPDADVITDEEDIDENVLNSESVVQNMYEANASCRASVAEANECYQQLQRTKNEILQQGQELMVESDRVLKTATVSYFESQQSLAAPLPSQFQELCGRSALYEPGAHYAELAKNPADCEEELLEDPFMFQLFYSPHSMIEVERKSTGSIESEDMYQDSSLFEPDTKQSKAALTHNFRSLRTPGRCRECDSYVYFMGVECIECGMVCHKKCVVGLSITCGHRRLPRKVPVFGTDLNNYLSETAHLIPFIICKCIDEIDARGRQSKGIYRVSGVKTKLDKLCNAFEIGGDLVDLSDIHPNVIADVLKIYLRQLPEPLLSFKLYPDFVRLAKEFASDEDLDRARCVQSFRELVARLPKSHYLTLAALMLHLKRVADEADVNNMPASNLGIVFGPTLLRPDESMPSMNSLVDTAQNSRAVELMIRLSDELFSSEEVWEARQKQLKMRERLAQAQAQAQQKAARGGSFRLPGTSRSHHEPDAKPRPNCWGNLLGDRSHKLVHELLSEEKRSQSDAAPSDQALARNDSFSSAGSALNSDEKANYIPQLHKQIRVSLSLSNASYSDQTTSKRQQKRSMSTYGKTAFQSTEAVSSKVSVSKVEHEGKLERACSYRRVTEER
ncbi:rho GTPase-activating protein 45-like [Schistocerca piceifrons]|uniref:rho GTPase-activating protein 45-like n=1 Tax=Schistocerca piceifrons TaxID=274613 RepID=UPI001F5E8EB2|nr:rho GTPase-activating protein 45-like [Schistocerca piceifrons]